MSQYHDNDFSWDDYVGKITSILPAVEEEIIRSNGTAEDWNLFYQTHDNGDFYKPRNYLALEFSDYLSSPEVERVLEVGCGFGCSMYPLLKCHNFQYFATDYSSKSLEILRINPLYQSSRTTDAIWDVSCEPDQTILDFMPNIVLAVFSLSAVHPHKHIQSFSNIARVLSSSKGILLFRDYGLHDMTMYRHKKRHGENFFIRNDGTIAYYFDLDYVRNLATSAGLNVVELKYATVKIQNRKKLSEMCRVFIHAVFSVD